MTLAKSGLRAAMRSARRAMDAGMRAAESAAVCAACLPLLPAGVCGSYAALPDEVDLIGLHRHLWSAGRAVLLPRVAGPGRLTWHRVAGPDCLRPGAYGIAEPDPSLAPAAELPDGAVVLVPGVAFCADGRRLGQGGGFYDRLLEARPDLRAIGVGFACQLVDDLPAEAHDRRMHALVIAGRIVLGQAPA
ncbi:MAG: 5-formyltetrahydrofolate cyclo-ligase [Planctomycetes bacterium]|nr:5-formyltetrahydrofolate cyclo-ligase [Planctomycetota bacterium]